MINSRGMRRLVLVAMLAARTAGAQPTEFTKEFQAGVDDYRLGRYAQARGHLENARALDPKLPGPHRFLAAVAQAEGRWQDCIDGARHAIELNPASSEIAETRKLHDECRASAGHMPYRGPELGDSAAIAVTTNVPGATVKIGGLVYGGTPMAPRPITAGALELEVDKPGYQPAHVTASALPGIVTDVAVELEPAPETPDPGIDVKPEEKPMVGWLELPFSWSHHQDPKRGCVAGLAESVSVDGREVEGSSGRIELAPGTREVEIHAVCRDPWRRRIRIVAGQATHVAPSFVETATREHVEHVGFALLGGGGALAVAGFVAFLVSEHAANDARDIVRVETARDPLNPATSVEPLRTRADFEAARSRASTYAIASDLAYGAALVTAGIGAYFLYTGGRERTDAPAPFAIAPTRGGVVVGKELAW